MSLSSSGPPRQDGGTRLELSRPHPHLVQKTPKLSPSSRVRLGRTSGRLNQGHKYLSAPRWVLSHTSWCSEPTKCTHLGRRNHIPRLQPFPSSTQGWPPLPRRKEASAWKGGLCPAAAEGTLGASSSNWKEADLRREACCFAQQNPCGFSAARCCAGHWKPAPKATLALPSQKSDQQATPSAKH